MTVSTKAMALAIMMLTPFAANAEERLTFSGSITTGLDVEHSQCRVCRSDNDRGRWKWNIIGVTLSPDNDSGLSFGVNVAREFGYEGRPHRFNRSRSGDNLIVETTATKAFGDGEYAGILVAHESIDNRLDVGAKLGGDIDLSQTMRLQGHVGIRHRFKSGANSRSLEGNYFEVEPALAWDHGDWSAGVALRYQKWFFNDAPDEQEIFLKPRVAFALTDRPYDIAISGEFGEFSKNSPDDFAERSAKLGIAVDYRLTDQSHLATFTSVKFLKISNNEGLEDHRVIPLAGFNYIFEF